jgi:hypothetical protein
MRSSTAHVECVQGMFEDAQLAAFHGRRVTIKVSDFFLTRKIRGEVERSRNYVPFPQTQPAASGSSSADGTSWHNELHEQALQDAARSAESQQQSAARASSILAQLKVGGSPNASSRT